MIGQCFTCARRSVSQLFKLSARRRLFAVSVLLLASHLTMACDAPSRPLAELTKKADAIVVVTLVHNPRLKDGSPLQFNVNDTIKGTPWPGSEITIQNVPQESAFYDSACQGKPLLVFLNVCPKGGWTNNCTRVYDTLGASNLLLHAIKDYADALAGQDKGDLDRRILAVSLKYVSVPDFSPVSGIRFLRSDCARNIYKIVVEDARGALLSKTEKAHIVKTMEETYNAELLTVLLAVMYEYLKEDERVFWLRRIARDAHSGDGIIMQRILMKEDAVVEKAILEPLRAKPKDIVTAGCFQVLYSASEAIRRRTIEEFKGDADYAPYIQELKASLPSKAP